MSIHPINKNFLTLPPQKFVVGMLYKSVFIETHMTRYMIIMTTTRIKIHNCNIIGVFFVELNITNKTHIS